MTSLRPLRGSWATTSLLAATALTFSGCGDDPSGPAKSAAVATVQVRYNGVAPADASLAALGDTVHLTARALDSKGNLVPGSTFSWSSSDESIATVSPAADSRGEVLAVGPGIVTIRAMSGGVSGAGTLSIRQVITAVTLSPTEVNLPALGKTASIQATARDRNGHVVPGSTFNWKSSDDSKASVAADGEVKAVAPGNITVTATTGEVAGSAEVHIVQEVSRVEVTPPSESILAGETVQLSATAFDAGEAEVADIAFTWTSSNSSVARVDGLGLVTGVAEGDPVTIMATVGGESGSATVIVSPAPVASVSVRPNNATIAMDETRQFEAILTDAFANRLSGRGVSWSSSNNAIATVSDKGLVTAVGLGGPVTITAKSEGEAGTATVSVFRVEPPIETTMSPGGDFTCALTRTGQPYCWGKNNEGQLGNGSVDDSASPVVLQGGHSFESISAGAAHACGLKSDGRVYCWGQNDYGQLGDGSNSDRPVAVAVVGGLTFRSVSSGSAHSCALSSIGKAYCWGDNSEGQLGDGTRSTRSAPTPVSGDLKFLTISAGYGYTCGTTNDYVALCWGYNAFGQIGDGSTSNRNTPTAVATTLDLRAIYAGANVTCALTVIDEPYCWGRNSDGQLGNGTTLQSNAPVAVAGGRTFHSIRLGVDHSCALTTSGTAYCWGRNHGLLGNGGTASSSQPVEVAGGHSFETLGVGRQHSCAVTAGGKAFCWGTNSNGQLGDGTTSARSVPVAVVGSQTYAAWEPIPRHETPARPSTASFGLLANSAVSLESLPGAFATRRLLSRARLMSNTPQLGYPTFSMNR